MTDLDRIEAMIDELIDVVNSLAYAALDTEEADAITRNLSWDWKHAKPR